MDIKELVNQLNYYTKKYDEGNPEISDKEWDDLYFQLVKLENETGVYLEDSPTQKVSYSVVNSLEKKEHNHPMLSLDKTKDWGEFLNYFGDYDVIGMCKLDGLTCCLTYENGYLISAETRGNGVVGEDILHNAKVIKSIPKRIAYTERLVIDGEMICTYKDFEQFSNLYKNPRNFVSGSIRLLDSARCEKRNLTFIVWNVVEGPKETVIENFNFVETQGFKVVPWTSSFDWDAKEFLIDQAKKYGYPIDGLVGRFNNINYGESLGATGHHTRAAYAFKFYDETYETHLIDIEWTMGRTGILTPVAVFDPIDADGSIIERASLHNYSVMMETIGHPFVGQRLSVFKANMIIPQICDADIQKVVDYFDEYTYISRPLVCPICGGDTALRESDSGTTNLVCDNPDCGGKLINRLDHFCGKKGLDIKGLSKMTLEKLINWGWVNNIIDIFSLYTYRDQWIKVPGFGSKSVDNILNAIENAKSCELWQFISALGIPLIGSTYAKAMCKKEIDWHNIREDIDGHFKFYEAWEGFGPEMTFSLWQFNYEEADKISEILNLQNSLFCDIINTELKLKDMTFVITGSLNQFKNRNELKELIEKNGGKVVDSVSKKTTYLINNDVNSSSSKNIKAKQLNIPILTEEKFLEII